MVITTLSHSPALSTSFSSTVTITSPFSVSFVISYTRIHSTMISTLFSGITKVYSLPSVTTVVVIKTFFVKEPFPGPTPPKM